MAKRELKRVDTYDFNAALSKMIQTAEAANDANYGPDTGKFRGYSLVLKSMIKEFRRSTGPAFLQYLKESAQRQKENRNINQGQALAEVLKPFVEEIPTAASKSNGDAYVEVAQ